MKIALASDHAGYRYKTMLSRFLTEAGHEIVDFGTRSVDPVDYPDYIRPAAESVASGDCERGIVLGGSGNGEAMAANRVPGVRCALCWNDESARLARAHNDANMISLGERMLTEQEAIAIVDIWLKTEFDGGRHSRRIVKLDGPEGTSVERQTVMRSVITKSVVLPAPPAKLFEMYLDSSVHAAITGMPAKISKETGAVFEAFDGLLNGTMLQVVEPRLIVQSWRSVSFKDDDPDSTLIISFTPEGDGGRIDLVHLDVPEHDFKGVTGGWDTKYFGPWHAYLEGK